MFFCLFLYLEDISCLGLTGNAKFGRYQTVQVFESTHFSNKQREKKRKRREAYLQKCVCRNEKTQWLHILVGLHLVYERSTVPVDCYQAVNIGQMQQPARIAATSIECKLANLWSRYS